MNIKYTALLFLTLNFILLQTSFAETGRYRLMFYSNTTTEVTIGFDAFGGNTNPVLYYGTSTIDVNNLNNYQNATPYKVNVKYNMNNCFVKLSNLAAAQKYYFVVKDIWGVSEVYQFETLSNSNDAKFSIIGGGDSRNLSAVRKVANKIVSKLNAHAFMFSGDFTDNGTGLEWENWLDDWQFSISENNRLTPLIITRGNHETNSMLADLFDFPDEGYYCTTIGDDLLKIYTLNSEIPLYGDQTLWFQNDLQQSGIYKWKFVQYHQPTRPHFKQKIEGHRQYAQWANLFYQYNINMVLEGDGHLVKSTWPIAPCAGGFDCEEGFRRDDYNGTVYIGEGAYSAPLRVANDPKSWTRDSDSFHQFRWMHIDKNKVDIRSVRYTDSTEVNIIPTLTDNNRFIIPNNLEIWNASNGDVVTLNAKDNTDVICNIVNPAHNSFYNTGSNINFNCTVNQNVNNVQYFVNGSFVGSVNSTPFNFNWTAPANGVYLISAIASTANGLSSTITNSSIIITSQNNIVQNSSIDIHSDEYYEKISNGFINNYGPSYYIKVASDNDNIQGLRFKRINIPKNAIIDSAKITFINKNGGGIANTLIWGEKTTSSLPFKTDKWNLSDRNKTVQNVNWDIPNWYGSIPLSDRTTPNLAAIVQELVSQPGWSVESAITFLMKGNGKRNAKSFASINQISPDSNDAPRLTITYSLPACPYCETATQSGDSYNAQSCITSNDSISNNIAEVNYNAGDAITLESGFSLSAATNFSINIDSCN